MRCTEPGFVGEKYKGWEEVVGYSSKALCASALVLETSLMKLVLLLISEVHVKP